MKPLFPWILTVSLAVPTRAFAQGPAADIPPAEDDPDRPTAVVHIESDAPVLLELRDDHRWIAVCVAPCEGRVPLLFVGWIWVLATLGSVSDGSGPDSGRLASGIAIGSVGLAAVVVGVALLAGYPNTNVTQGGRGRRPSQDAWLPLPAWRESEAGPARWNGPFRLSLFEATF